MANRPRILRVETGFVTATTAAQGKHMLDYQVYQEIPRWWRRLEELLRLDLYLALRAKRRASEYDIIWAGSEKVGIPLALMRIQQPLVVIAHYMESPLRARLAKMFGIAQMWAGIGYVSNESRDFLINYLGARSDRLFQCESAKYLNQQPSKEIVTDGPIMSVGVAKRDYNTFIAAVAELPGYTTELFVSSKYGDALANQITVPIPEWVQFVDFVPLDELLSRYRASRFVVVCMEDTKHTGAGITAVLEAGALGKAVIATRTGGMQTFVKDGETGILVPPYDVVALRDAIQLLWTQPELAHQMGMANRRYVERQFNPKVVQVNINDMLDKIYCNIHQ